jgi:hypothetical protein
MARLTPEVRAADVYLGLPAHDHDRLTAHTDTASQFTLLTVFLSSSVPACPTRSLDDILAPDHNTYPREPQVSIRSANVGELKRS